MINNVNQGVFVKKSYFKIVIFHELYTKKYAKSKSNSDKISKDLYKIHSRTRYARLEDTAQNRVLLYKIRLIGERIR